ncbi:hypothetical protein PR001_g15145 [Phytophthora rubi]|uniref:DDE-1 domain-containing protein n=1 Tax=Phytophthora rubi TaxID=129364 RepID=A0A6A3L496_9STRA|nr:hypothetical protein PR001_g15145 [Phytophthora rubi]
MTPSPFRFLGGLDSPTTAGSSTFFAGMDVRHRRGHEGIGSVDLPPARKAALELRKVSSNDVFYMDEAAFFYNASPTSSICLVSGPAHKKKKGRMPIVVATNSSGTEKIPLLFLDKPKKPKSSRIFLLLLDNDPVHITPEYTLSSGAYCWTMAKRQYGDCAAS